METAFDIKISFSQDWYFPPDYKRKAQQDRKKPKAPKQQQQNLVWVKIFIVVMVKMLPVLSLPSSLALASELNQLLYGTATTLAFLGFLLLLAREETYPIRQTGM